MGDAEAVFFIGEHGHGGVDGMALGLAGSEGAGAFDAMLLDQPVNFTHGRRMGKLLRRMQVGLY
jgi:hypothetical protein